MSDVQISDPVESAEWTPARIAALECVERGEGRGKCHVFLDNSGRCQCGERDLSKFKMKVEHG
jgi:hypothetical protein